FRGSQF
ncbi:putative inclusion membrane protein, partial [Chlamydia psittaci 08-2626_L3]